MCARGVMVIVVGNGHGYSDNNQSLAWYSHIIPVIKNDKSKSTRDSDNRSES